MKTLQPVFTSRANPSTACASSLEGRTELSRRPRAAHGEPAPRQADDHAGAARATRAAPRVLGHGPARRPPRPWNRCAGASRTRGPRSACPSFTRDRHHHDHHPPRSRGRFVRSPARSSAVNRNDGCTRRGPSRAEVPPPRFGPSPGTGPGRRVAPRVRSGVVVVVARRARVDRPGPTPGQRAVGDVGGRRPRGGAELDGIQATPAPLHRGCTRPRSPRHEGGRSRQPAIGAEPERGGAASPRRRAPPVEFARDRPRSAGDAEWSAPGTTWSLGPGRAANAPSSPSPARRARLARRAPGRRHAEVRVPRRRGRRGARARTPGRAGRTRARARRPPSARPRPGLGGDAPPSTDRRAEAPRAAWRRRRAVGRAGARRGSGRRRPACA